MPGSGEMVRPRRRQVLAGALGTASALSMTTGSFAQDRTSVRSLAERFAASLSAHDLVAFGALFAEDYINHQVSAATPPPKDRTAKQVTLGIFQARLIALPDLAVSIEALVAAEDRVAASFLYTGTHRGTFFGVAPTGRTFTFTSCDIFKARDDRIVEHWGMGDTAGVMAQLKA